jgi:hypothetical protein
MVRRVILGLVLCGTLAGAGCSSCGHSWCGWWRRRCCDPCPPAAAVNNNYVNPAHVPAAPPPGAVVAPPPGAVTAPPPGAVVAPSSSQFGPTPDAVVPSKPLYSNGSYR